MFRAINRLDRDTTGLLIVAKNALSSCILSDMVKKRQIHRTYLAAVNGNLSDQPEGKADEILEADVPDHRVGSSYCGAGWD